MLKFTLRAMYSVSFNKLIMTSIHRYTIIKDSFPNLRVPCVLSIHSSLLPPESLATTNLFSVSMVFPFPECHIAGVLPFVTFSDWLLSMFFKVPLGLFVAWWLFFFFFSWIIFHCVDTCTAVCLFIHLLKAILVASQFWQLWVKLL